MKKIKSPKDAFLLFIIIISWAFFAYFLIGETLKTQSLYKNLKYTKAIVIDDFFGIRQTNYFRYEFCVDEKMYRGRGVYYPKQETISVGDTITIGYDKTNPDNSTFVRDLY